MKRCIAVIIALTTVLPLAWTQISLDEDLLYMRGNLRTLDVNRPSFSSFLPTGAYSINESHMAGSLVFYGDGLTLLNVHRSGNSGSMHQVGLFSPAGMMQTASTASSVFFDRVNQQPENLWSVGPGASGFAPVPNVQTPRPQMQSYASGPGSVPGNNAQLITRNNSQTYVFWTDPSTAGTVNMLANSEGPDESNAALVIHWRESIGVGTDDNFAAISHLRPYVGVVPVPEPATYLGASVLLLFIGGRLWKARRNRKR